MQEVNSKRKPYQFLSILKAIGSFFVWGLGQLFNRQYLKALFFFIIFFGMVGIELGTSKYFVKTGPYDRIQGQDLDDGTANGFIQRNYIVFYKNYIQTNYKDTKSIMPDSIYDFDLAYLDKTNAELVLSRNGFSLFVNDFRNRHVSAEETETFNALKEKIELLLPVAGDEEYTLKYSELETINSDYKDEVVYKKFNNLFSVYFGKASTYRYPTLTEQGLIDALAADLLKYNHKKYLNLETNEVFIVDEENQFEQREIPLILNEVIYEGLPGEFYIEKIEENDERKYYKYDLYGIDKIDTSVVLDNVHGLTKVTLQNDLFKINNKYYVSSKIDDDTEVTYINIFDTHDRLLQSEVGVPTKYTTQGYRSRVGSLYIIDDQIYEYTEPGKTLNNTLIQYQPTPLTNTFTYTMRRVFESPANSYTATDYTRFVIKVYLAMEPEVKAKFEKDYSNFFYEKAGLFIQSFWGVATLGTTKKMSFEHHRALENALVARRVDDSYVVNILPQVPLMGHVSTHILIESLIGIILFAFFIVFWIWTVRDAYITSMAKYQEEIVPENLTYFKKTYEKNFEYIVLGPVLFAIAFISIMPIIFSFLIAFTSIQGQESMIDTFDYVGFKNFINLFSFDGALGQTFGKAFWRVLRWTVVWAIFSTLTCFFGGFFQALILNSERVVFSRLWRTILILPWAMPALLSQMVFRVMFGETGYINNLFYRLGIYDLLKGWGWLGHSYSVLEGAERFFFLGENNIQWFTNLHNPTFVRIVLIVVNIWLGFPYFMALMSGIMTSIDRSLYEAADIDGASGFQKIAKITMPLVLYSTAPILIMTFSGNFNNFGVIYFITGGGPNEGMYSRGFAGDTDILISWMYKLTVDEQIYNIASVFSVLIFIVVGSITVWNLSRTRAFKGD